MIVTNDTRMTGFLRNKTPLFYIAIPVLIYFIYLGYNRFSDSAIVVICLFIVVGIFVLSSYFGYYDKSLCVDTFLCPKNTWTLLVQYSSVNHLSQS